MTGRAAPERTGEGGYVLLALLASSAVIVATLALGLPRMAMQSQRDREQRLIERGEQYQRAIELYYREHNKYPEELEDLEDTDGVRYLRRRDDDPMGETGEWRIIHMGTDGRFEDSLLYDTVKEQPGGGQGAFGALTGDTTAPLPGEFSPPVPGNQAGLVPASTDGSPDPRIGQGPQPLVGSARARTVRESAAPDLAARDRYSQGFDFNTGQVPVGKTESEEPQDRSRMLPSMVPMDENERSAEARYGPNGLPIGSAGGVPGTIPGFPQASGNVGTPPGVPGSPAVANQPGRAAGSGATEMIHRLLTTPRSASQAGVPGAQPAVAVQQVFERGIAGVASTSEELGVKVYEGRQAYSEWEFVFDYRKAAGIAGESPQDQPGGGRAPPGTQSGSSSRGISSRSGIRPRR